MSLFLLKSLCSNVVSISFFSPTICFSVGRYEACMKQSLDYGLGQQFGRQKLSTKNACVPILNWTLQTQDNVTQVHVIWDSRHVTYNPPFSSNHWS